MPRSADGIRTRLLKKLTLKREEEERNALSVEKLRTAQIKETRGKIDCVGQVDRGGDGCVA